MNEQSGILLLDKPSGITSNAALGRAKRILSIRKAGHTGTLDPMASGLLVLCFGEATKVSAFLLDADKAYLARARLGLVTDSEDAEGQVIEQNPVPELDSDSIEQVLAAFRGPIDQVPPMYSALKHQGKRLYELARKGETVERPARRVVIHDLDLLSMDAEHLDLAVTCSKGTYIRSLVRDIGVAISCGAHLSALRRTMSAPFQLDDAVTLDVLDGLGRDEARALLLPPDQALQHLPAIKLDPLLIARLRQGQKLADIHGTQAGLMRVYGEEGFVAIGESDGLGHLKVKRLFHVG
jgi:tRNA pseudouridine55 synthase